MANPELVEDIQAAYRAGELETAASLCATILDGEPAEAWALHMLGLVHAQRLDHARAAELIGRAVAARPNSALFHINLAEAYRNLGQWRRAEGSCRMALMLSPDYSEASNTLGLVLYGQGRYAEAVEEFRRALASRPELPNPHGNLGLALQKLGRLDEALVHLARAVEIEPALPRFRTNLGLALVDAGRAGEALDHFREVARLQPDAALAHHNVGNALRLLGRGLEARASYAEALRLDLGLAASHLHMGMTLRRDGQLDEAVIWHRTALNLSPGDWTIWEQAGELYTEREEYREAIPIWEKALELCPTGNARIRLNLGWALQEDGRLAEAQAQYQAALELHPDWSLTWHYIGGIHEEAGELAEAEAAYRRALQLNPSQTQTLARLGLLLREKMTDADVGALEARTADRGSGDPALPRMLFALAHHYDGRGHHGRAAAALRGANAMTLQASRGRREYRPEDHERFVDGLIRAFDAAHFGRVAGSGSASRRPVFIFGLPRSGTTLVEQILASHPDAHGAGELRVARDIFDSVPAVLGRSESAVGCVPHLDPTTIGRLAEDHLGRLAELDGGAHGRIADKMPDNFLYLGLIGTLFPEATLIHCRRDLRDVAVSCWLTDFRYIRWANDFGHIASRFVQYRRLMGHWESVIPARIHRIDYEETVADLEGVARRLVGACGLGWDPACLEFHRGGRTVRTASVTQVRQPIYKKSVARWRHYEAELADLFRELPRELGEPAPAPSDGPGILDPDRRDGHAAASAGLKS